MPPDLCDELATAAHKVAWNAKCDELLRMLQNRKWRRQTHRTNISHEYAHTQRVSKEGKPYHVRTVLHPQQSEYEGSGPMVEHVRSMLPAWMPQLEHFAVTLNRQVQCSPHKDKNNVGLTAILFLGEFTGGSLVLEDGRCFDRTREWFGYDGSAILHWNTPIASGVKYAIVAHNTKTKPEAFPYRKGRKSKDVAQECAPARDRPLQEEGDGL